jgi:hypothetical protein
MKSTVEFWKTIENYNLQTLPLQVFFSVLLIGVIIVTFFKKEQWITITLKSIFGILFFFVGICFFLMIDQSFIAMIFGPFFIIIGCLFFIEVFRSTVPFQSPTPMQYVLYGLVLSYPVVSYLLDHHYPQQVLYILPCPLVSFALITYSRTVKRNDLLNILLILWGLTGVKAFIFDIKEDLILLVVGIYGLIDYISYRKNLKTIRPS